MTPGKFEYHLPTTVDEAVQLLSRFGDTARVLAGGHSLIPMMKLRLANPEQLIDITGIGDLNGISRQNGTITVGAATTQAELLASRELGDACPLIAETVAVIADPQIRNCGTIGGNVANGDPGNDMPAVMMALGATFVLRGPGGERDVAATAFYRGTFDTALASDEILTAIRIPVPAAGHGYAYQKLKRKVGDYATAATAVILELDGATCRRASITLTNVGPAPIDATAAAAELSGKAIDDGAVEQAAQRAIDAADPADDFHGPAAYRKQMAGEMTRRAIRLALTRARGG